MDFPGVYGLQVIATKPGWNRIVPSPLNAPCEPVDLADPLVLGVLEDVIFEMFRTMYGTFGVGLAAPQIGIRWQLAVIDTCDKEDPRAGRIVLVNPRILVDDATKTVAGNETCLSIPNHEGTVPRYERIRVENRTLSGELETLEAEGFFARVIQHETDHLQGKTYLDRLTPGAAPDTNTPTTVARRAARVIESLNVRELLSHECRPR